MQNKSKYKIHTSDKLCPCGEMHSRFCPHAFSNHLPLYLHCALGVLQSRISAGLRVALVSNGIGIGCGKLQKDSTGAP